MLSQFSSGSLESAVSKNKQTLKEVFKVPNDVYPVGRLDYDSEGLLILTNDTSLNHRLLNPSFAHEREYWVQVEGLINQPALDQLKAGVEIMVDGKTHLTKKAKAKSIEEGLLVPERNPPIRFRKDIPTSWLSLVLTEGKNRQVRKMTAKVGFPTLRLIRYRIGKIDIAGMKAGSIVELNGKEIYQLLF